MRSPSRPTRRPSGRHHSRMLGGARRPRPTNYLAIACQALNEVIRIDERLRPFMQEKVRMLEQCRRDQEIEALLRKVYSEAEAAAVPPRSYHSKSVQAYASSFLKEELALSKSRFVLDCLKSKLEKR